MRTWLTSCAISGDATTSFEFSQPPNPGEPLTSPAYPGVTTAGTRSPDVFITGGIEFGTPTFLERTKFPFETRNQIADTVTLTAGNHTIKWGGDFNNVKDVQDNLRYLRWCATLTATSMTSSLIT